MQRDSQRNPNVFLFLHVPVKGKLSIKFWNDTEMHSTVSQFFLAVDDRVASQNLAYFLHFPTLSLMLLTKLLFVMEKNDGIQKAPDYTTLHDCWVCPFSHTLAVETCPWLTFLSCPEVIFKLFMLLILQILCTEQWPI
jgi:hypothetical protein